jgi:hypothetical protein
MAKKRKHEEGGYVDEFGFGGILQAIAPFANLIPGVGPVLSGLVSGAGGLMEQGDQQEELLAEQNRLKAISKQKSGQAGIINNYLPTFRRGGLAKYPDGGNLFNTNKTAYVDSVLNANKNIEWVQRLRNRSTPSIQVPGYAAPSTHLMSHNGQGYVFPQVVDRGKGLEYMPEDKAMIYALNTDTGIQLGKEQAGWFAANGYKKGTGVLQREYSKGGLAQEPNETGVELEKQETFQTPGGQVGQVNGPSHEQGGVEMNLPAGSFVWSDELKIPQQMGGLENYAGKTFAEVSAQLLKMKAKYEKILNS